MNIKTASLASIVTLGSLVSIFTSPISYAGAERGVKCPSGYTASYSGSSKILRCKKTSNQYAASVCPNFPFNIYKVRVGTDKCATVDVVHLPVTGPIPTGLSSKLRNVKCAALPGTSGWVLDKDKINSGGGKKYKDRCKRSISSYAWPQHR